MESTKYHSEQTPRGNRLTDSITREDSVRQKCIIVCQNICRTLTGKYINQHIHAAKCSHGVGLKHRHLRTSLGGFLTTYALIVHIDTYIKETYMRTTLNIEDHLIKKVSELTGIKEKTTLVKLGLEALIAMESSKRLAKLGGTEKELKMIRRRRIAKE